MPLPFGLPPLPPLREFCADFTDPEKRRTILAACIGSVIEWYDFAVFGFFAEEIGLVFFPGCDGSLRLIKSFGVFGAAFIMRPVGGVILGIFGDKFGRKAALQLSIALMIFPSLGMALLPSYEQVGFFSPVMLLVIRLIQGVAVGGELIGSVLFMVESSPLEKRGKLGAFCFSFAILGTACGALAGAFVRLILSPAAVTSYGWRLCFVFGFLMGLAASVLRRGLEEPDEFQEAQAGAEGGELPRNPLKVAMTDYRTEVSILLFSSAIWCSGFYTIFIWMGTFFGSMADADDVSVPAACAVGGHGATLTCPAKEKADIMFARGINFFMQIFLMFLFPWAGWLSDTWAGGDRLKVMRIGATAIGVLAVPLFSIFLLFENTISVLLVQGVMTVCMALVGGPMAAWWVDAFPPLVRYTGVGTGYNFSQALFGGTAPLLASFFIREACTVLPDPAKEKRFSWENLAPFVWLSFLSLISVITMNAAERHFVRTGGQAGTHQQMSSGGHVELDELDDAGLSES